VPDLVVVVGAQRIVTRVFTVGTWRDVNLENTPQEIIDGELSVSLTPFDYDDGFIGRFPPSREEP
jgi:predicted amino acid-binding ACT domain protein